MMAPETVVTVDNNQANKPSEGEHPLAWLNPYVEYFRTVPGIVKLVELLFGIICMATASAYLSGTHWFLFVVVTSFISTLLWSFVYLLRLRENLKLPINWILTELVNTSISTVLYLIAFIVQLSVWSPVYGGSIRASNLTAGCFGLFNTLVYAYGAYLLYLDHKSTTPAS